MDALEKKVEATYPTPWHLEGPYELDANRWGPNIAIVAANDECVVHQYGSFSWAASAELIVNRINKAAGYDLPARELKRKPVAR